MEKNKMNFGAIPSHHDPRTVQFTTQVTSLLVEGGLLYYLKDILNQWYVGICTAISLVQNREKKTGKKYSADFQYLLQKKMFDNAWYEGSSIFNALKVGYNVGFLPEELWKWTTEEDRKLPYAKYIAKLQAIPDSEIERLKKLCVDKIGGYAQVNVDDSQAIAKAINTPGSTGVLCCFAVGNEWYSPKSPLPAPKNIIGYHAIGMTKFNYAINLTQTLANTWGVWGKDGSIDIWHDKYKPLEVWVILESAPIIPPITTEKIVTLTRESDNGIETLGKLEVDNFSCFTLEKPDKQNKINISCIPKGSYKCIWAYFVGLKQYHYYLKDVRGRGGIFIHQGNFVKNTQGCILVGNKKEDVNKDGQIDVLNSVATLTAFEKLMDRKPFTLVIK